VDSSSSVGWLMLSVVRRCVSASPVVLVLFAHEQSIADGVELMIIIVATFGQAVSGQAPAIHIIGILVVWRFVVSPILPPFVKSSVLSNRSDGPRHRW
jgi:hypothetical protein